MIVSWKRIALRVGLVLATVLLGAVVAESVFRWFLATGTVPTDDARFEEVVSASWPRPIPPEREKGTLRIVALADSFGVSGGEANFHYLLEGSLRSKGLPVEVVNLSVGGYSLLEEHELLVRFGGRYRPDVVLHSFFIGNDFILPRYRGRTYRGITVPLVPGWEAWKPSNWLLPLWMGRYRASRANREAAAREREPGQEKATFAEAEFLRIEALRLSIFLRPSGGDVLWPGVTRALDAIHAHSREIGARSVLVVHPDQIQIERDLLETVLRRYGLSGDDYAMELPGRYLHGYAASRRIPLVDLVEPFRRASAGESLYLRRDTHYNPEGNRLAAAQVEKVIEPILRAILAEREGAAAAPATGPGPHPVRKEAP